MSGQQHLMPAKCQRAQCSWLARYSWLPLECAPGPQVCTVSSWTSHGYEARIKLWVPQFWNPWRALTSTASAMLNARESCVGKSEVTFGSSGRPESWVVFEFDGAESEWMEGERDVWTRSISSARTHYLFSMCLHLSVAVEPLTQYQAQMVCLPLAANGDFTAAGFVDSAPRALKNSDNIVRKMLNEV